MYRARHLFFLIVVAIIVGGANAHTYAFEDLHMYCGAGGGMFVSFTADNTFASDASAYAMYVEVVSSSCAYVNGVFPSCIAAHPIRFQATGDDVGDVPPLGRGTVFLSEAIADVEVHRVVLGVTGADLTQETVKLKDLKCSNYFSGTTVACTSDGHHAVNFVVPVGYLPTSTVIEVETCFSAGKDCGSPVGYSCGEASYCSFVQPAHGPVRATFTNPIAARGHFFQYTVTASSSSGSKKVTVLPDSATGVCRSYDDAAVRCNLKTGSNDVMWTKSSAFASYVVQFMYHDAGMSIGADTASCLPGFHAISGFSSVCPSVISSQTACSYCVSAYSCQPVAPGAAAPGYAVCPCGEDGTCSVNLNSVFGLDAVYTDWIWDNVATNSFAAMLGGIDEQNQRHHAEQFVDVGGCLAKATSALTYSCGTDGSLTLTFNHVQSAIYLFSGTVEYGNGAMQGTSTLNDVLCVGSAKQATALGPDSALLCNCVGEWCSVMVSALVLNADPTYALQDVRSATLSLLAGSFGTKPPQVTAKPPYTFLIGSVSGVTCGTTVEATTDGAPWTPSTLLPSQPVRSWYSGSFTGTVDTVLRRGYAFESTPLGEIEEYAVSFTTRTLNGTIEPRVAVLCEIFFQSTPVTYVQLRAATEDGYFSTTVTRDYGFTLTSDAAGFIEFSLEATHLLAPLVQVRPINGSWALSEATIAAATRLIYPDAHTHDRIRHASQGDMRYGFARASTATTRAVRDAGPLVTPSQQPLFAPATLTDAEINDVDSFRTTVFAHIGQHSAMMLSRRRRSWDGSESGARAGSELRLPSETTTFTLSSRGSATSTGKFGFRSGHGRFFETSKARAAAAEASASALPRRRIRIRPRLRHRRRICKEPRQHVRRDQAMRRFIGALEKTGKSVLDKAKDEAEKVADSIASHVSHVVSKGIQSIGLESFGADLVSSTVDGVDCLGSSESVMDTVTSKIASFVSSMAKKLNQDTILYFTEMAAVVVQSMAVGADVALSVTSEAILATFYRVYNDLHALVTAVISTIVDLMDLMLTYLEQLAIFIYDFILWLLMLFDWGDYILSMKAIAAGVRAGFKFLPSVFAGAGFGGSLGGLVGTLLSEMNAVPKLSLPSDPIEVPKAKMPFNSGPIGRFIMNLLQKAEAKIVDALVSSVLKALDLKEVTTFASALDMTAFQTAGSKALFSLSSKLKVSGNAFPSPSVQDMFEALSDPDFGLESLAEALGEALTNLEAPAAAIVGQLASDLENTIDIPLLSALFEFVTGGEALTLLNALALMVAVPFTFMSKVAGFTPFSSGDAGTIEDAGAAFFGATGASVQAAFSASFESISKDVSGRGRRRRRDYRARPRRDTLAGNESLPETLSAALEFMSGSLTFFGNFVCSDNAKCTTAFSFLEVIGDMPFVSWMEGGMAAPISALGTAQWALEALVPILGSVLASLEGDGSGRDRGGTIVDGNIPSDENASSGGGGVSIDSIVEFVISSIVAFLQAVILGLDPTGVAELDPALGPVAKPYFFMSGIQTLLGPVDVLIMAIAKPESLVGIITTIVWDGLEAAVMAAGFYLFIASITDSVTEYQS